MTRKPRILVVGSLVLDLICTTPKFPQKGETIIGYDFNTAPGGKGANQAVQAARLGADVTMVGKVGDDDFGRQLTESLNQSGVNTDNLFVTDKASSAVGCIQLEVTDSGTSNRILVLPGANMQLLPDDVAFLENEITQYDMVIMQLEIPIETNLAVAKIAHKHNIPVMLNSAPSKKLPEELLACLTYISPNEHEAADIVGFPVDDDESVKAASKALCDMGTKNVLITLGSRGSAFSNEQEFFISPCYDYGFVIDPTAAGDSFIGAFCTAVCLGVSYREAAIFANHTAGITVSRMGAQPSLPNIDEVLDFMKKNWFDTSVFEVLKK